MPYRNLPLLRAALEHIERNPGDWRQDQYGWDLLGWAARLQNPSLKPLSPEVLPQCTCGGCVPREKRPPIGIENEPLPGPFITFLGTTAVGATEESDEAFCTAVTDPDARMDQIREAVAAWTGQPSAADLRKLAGDA